jgi:hypothetical protein
LELPPEFLNHATGTASNDDAVIQTINVIIDIIVTIGTKYEATLSAIS